jgi:branched-chain amino acid transport system ATP-binding protein
LLKLDGVDAYYGDLQALYDVALEVPEGRITALVGANAAGKSTTLRVIAGLLPPRRGQVLFDGRSIERVPAHARVGLGIVLVPEGRRLFPFLTVRENLLLGAHSAAARAQQRETMDRVFTLFPVLAERQSQLASSMSGGEQQMCAVGRALMAQPRLLMLDEPTLGLAPMMVGLIFDTVRTINQAGVTVLLVEQNVQHTLVLADQAYVLESGRVVLAGPGRDILGDERLRRAYLGM